MGLCKCPRKRMTNLFCFEHHVNVCEDCLVRDHGKCIIKSYLNWLEDSDYDASCPLCHRALQDGECTHLVCYHLFHWSCLNRYASSLPANTAPAGYKCLTCSQGLFPKSNAASPVADALRKQLESVNWGRAGLGLGLLDENGNPTSTFAAPDSDGPIFPSHSHPATSKETTISFDAGAFEREPVRRTGDSHEMRPLLPSGSASTASRREESQWSSNDRDSDHVEVKYKRKPFGEWFQRLVRAYVPRPSANDAKAGLRRLFVSVLVILVMLLTFGVFLTSLNRSPSYEEAPAESADLNLDANDKAKMGFEVASA